MFGRLCLATWILASLPVTTQPAGVVMQGPVAITPFPGPSLDPKRCEDYPNTVFCSRRDGDHTSTVCFFTLCDAVNAGFSQCRAPHNDETCD